MRFGLVGTGHWARTVHAPALVSSDGVELVGVWGRDPAKAKRLADEHDATAYDDVDAMLGDVDAVAFAVPPGVQGPVAARAASAGCHLLLEKPTATSVDEAAVMVDAAEATGVTSVVFVTGRFQPEVRRWLDEASRRTWHGGQALWLCSAFHDGSPYADSVWRREKGGLWDVGPHALGVLLPALGPVTRVSATRGRDDLTHLALHHEGGATSTVSLTLHAPPQAFRIEATLWGEAGVSAMPHPIGPAADALRTAIAELRDLARDERSDHPCDVRFGRDVVAILAEAERQVDATSR